MKKLLTLLSLLIVAVSTFGQTFTVDDLEYTVLSSTDKTAKVSNGKNATGDVVVPETVMYKDVEYSVTEIGNSAFRDNANLVSIDMPAATSIGSYAFQYCISLASVSLPAATSIDQFAFSNCSSLASVSLPAATSIDQFAFSDCSSLSSVSLPSVTSIGWVAFQGCSKISSLRIGSVEQWCNVNFGSDASPLYSASQSVNLYIGNSDTPATEIEVPNTVTAIPDLAFTYTTITSISAPSATSIGNKAFQYCISLASVSLPAATTIGSSAFYNCSSLGSLSLPAATTIGRYAFDDCSKVKSLRIGSVEQWCNITFSGSYANPLAYTSQAVDLYIGDSEAPATDIEVPNTVTEIPDYAFRRTTITSFSAPAATSIGSSAFRYCSSLASVSLPAATSIGNYAFYNCSSLGSLSLPAATSIGSYAFSGCLEVKSLRIGSVEQWCNITFGYSDANPLACTLQAVDLYIGDSEAPATDIEVPNTVTEIPDHAFRRTTITSFSAPAAISIGSYAFSDCSSLASVSLPAAISIGNLAFSGCSSLASVSLPAATSIGSDAFYGCSKVKSLRIGSVEQWCNITFSGSYANPLYSALQAVDLYIGDSETCATELTIPSGVSQIPEYCYKGLNLHTIHFEDATPPALINTNAIPTWTMLAVPDAAYETYLAADVYNTIPLQITKEGSINQDVEVEADNATSKLLQKIGEDEVRYVVNLKVTGTINSYDMLIIRNQMPSLRNLDLTDASIVDCDYIYSNADGTNYHSQKDVITGDWLSGVMNVKLPSTTREIAKNAFERCDKLVSVEIPEGVTFIGQGAFRYCRRIKELHIPSSITNVGAQAFYWCSGLREVVIPDGMTTIGNQAFEECFDLEKVTIPASVTNINYYAFYTSKPLELHISSLEDWLRISFGGLAFNNVSRLYIGDSEEPTEDIVIPAETKKLNSAVFSGFTCIKSVSLPDELTTIGDAAFRDCSGLTEIVLPENLMSINSATFMDCSGLERVEFNDNIKEIASNAFYRCTRLTKVELPAYLQTIGSYAFYGCTGLEEVLIPASITDISDYAFQGCSNLNTVIATTVEPVTINQNTFSTYQTANLYSPKTSYYKYYWNTQWNQFLTRKEYDKEFAKSFGYKYFYLNGVNGDAKQDFEIDDETGIIHGVDEDLPDADFNEGAGVIVGGNQIQELGDIHIHHNGNNGASVIAKNSGKVHIDNLYVDIKTQKNRWYFFCFPFDINPGEATFDGSHVWYLYDGEARALNGNGGWKKLANDGVMQSGNGYIFQGAVNGTLTIHVKDITIDTDDTSTNMITYQSDNKNDASWNLIGNSNFAYYDIDNLGYDAPITIYNNETGNYEAVRAGEDDCELYPFQAFFVQKPEGTESMDFDNSKKETKNKSDEKKARRAAERTKAPKKVDALRKVINLELAEENMQNDSVAALSDRTRIVVNPTKSTAYEMDCDAAKFIADNMPQIYSLGNDGSMYAINERPEDNGIIKIAVKTVKNGMYTISASRLDREAKLRDQETGSVVDLSKGGYTFAADATTYTNRFQLILADESTAITATEDDMAAISVEAGAIRINKANADVKVYTVGGAIVVTQKGEGSISVPAGVYVVVVNGNSTKVTVK